tara:strand:- start:24 stop:182 length:159 start_codon:yes stop_codon:yes gene_type:complete
VLSNNKKQNPVLSVLTYSLNNAEFLKETIDSVFKQQYENLSALSSSSISHIS